jgi:hypothetical protein
VRALVQAVKRNIARFPDDFMFQLTRAEFANLKSQIVTSSWGRARRSAPYAFTDQGVAMLSSVTPAGTMAAKTPQRDERGRRGRLEDEATRGQTGSCGRGFAELLNRRFVV